MGDSSKPSTYVKIARSDDGIYWRAVLYVNGVYENLWTTYTRAGAERKGRRALRRALRAEKENAYYIYREDL